HRRTRQLDLRRPCGALGGTSGAAARRNRPYPRTSADYDGDGNRAYWHLALRTRTRTGWPSDPLRALSGDWRLSRRNRMVDAWGRYPGGHRPAAHLRRHRCVPEPFESLQAYGRGFHCDHALFRAAPFPKPIRVARTAVDRSRGGASRLLADRRL